MSTRPARASRADPAARHPPARNPSFLSSPLTLLLAGLLSLLFVYITAWDLLRTELEKEYGWVLPRSLGELQQRLSEVDWRNVEIDWEGVRQGAWKVVDPRQAFSRGQWFGAVIRSKGGEVVRQVRERLEL